MPPTIHGKPRRAVRAVCLGCGKPFLARADAVRLGMGKYCRRRCYTRHRGAVE